MIMLLDRAKNDPIKIATIDDNEGLGIPRLRQQLLHLGPDTRGGRIRIHLSRKENASRY